MSDWGRHLGEAITFLYKAVVALVIVVVVLIVVIIVLVAKLAS